MARKYVFTRFKTLNDISDVAVECGIVSKLFIIYTIDIQIQGGAALQHYYNGSNSLQTTSGKKSQMADKWTPDLPSLVCKYSRLLTMTGTEALIVASAFARLNHRVAHNVFSYLFPSNLPFKASYPHNSC